MSLASRESRFGELVSHFECWRPCPLIAAHRLRPEPFARLRLAAALYIASCLPDARRVTTELLADEEQLLAEVERQRPEIRNLTPNGMVVPKRELNLEYNIFVSAFAGVIATLGVDDFIDAWIHPPNLRVKEGAPTEDKLARPFASERWHTEAWIEMNTSRPVTVMIPLLGDTERNRVRFRAPGADFDETWLRPRASYEDGQAIAARYRDVDLGYEKGFLYVSDAATLHRSERLPGAGPRASIDVNFLVRPAGVRGKAAAPHVTQADLEGIGRKGMFVFSDSMNDHLDTRGGKRHPTERHRLIRWDSSPRP